MFVHPATDAQPGEFVRTRAATLPFALRIAGLSLLLSVAATLTAPLWLPFLLGAAIWGWPPHQVRAAEVARYLRRIWTERPPPPGLAPLTRVWLTLRVLQRVVILPVAGLAWVLDEVLYGRRLDATVVSAPLIVLSAQRSGSTQISRYLEEDPRLAAPAALQIGAPYLWLWRIATALVSPARAERLATALYARATTDEFRQRHEGNLLRTDTFEIFYYSQRLTLFAPLLGPRVMQEDFGFAGTAEFNRDYWERDFVDFIDRLGRKTLLFAGPRPDGTQRRFFVKGHFIEAAEALGARYPDGHFLTVVRDPVQRARSVLNHIHGNPFDEALGALPWSWLVAAAIPAEVTYCQREQAWFSQTDGPLRTVVRFDDYRRDLEATMSHIYRRCFSDEALPPHVPRVHAPRDRKNYTVNRSLEDLAVDAEDLGSVLADYRSWVADGPRL